jgi:hypothetical protein
MLAATRTHKLARKELDSSHFSKHEDIEEWCSFFIINKLERK